MNSSDSKSNSSPDKAIESPPADSNKIPSLADVRSHIKSMMHRTVVATNNALASLEQTTHSIQQSPAVTTIKHIEERTVSLASTTFEKGQHLYVHRRDYGPYWVAGSALTAGGLAGLRRGRIAGGLAGVLGASAAFVVVYEQQISLESAMDILFGREGK